MFEKGEEENQIDGNTNSKYIRSFKHGIKENVS